MIFRIYISILNFRFAFKTVSFPYPSSKYQNPLYLSSQCLEIILDSSIFLTSTYNYCHCYLQNMPQTHHLLFVSYASSLDPCITSPISLTDQVVSLLPCCVPRTFSPKGSQNNLHKHKSTNLSLLLKSVRYLPNEIWIMPKLLHIVYNTLCDPALCYIY